MRGKKGLFMLTTGFVLLIFDLVTDIVVAAHYGLKDEYWWFGLTLFFIIVPLFIISCMAWVQADDDFCGLLNCCLLFVCSSIFVRYAQEFKYWKQTHWDNPPCGNKECNCPDCKRYCAAVTKSNKSAYKLAWLRYTETLTESTPQWCLQMYIMLRQWDFPWLTVLSTVISLLSLAWSITALEKAAVNKEGHNFTLPATVVFFTSELFSLLSRLFAIAAFAYVFKGHVITALAVHWLIMYVVSWLWLTEDAECKLIRRIMMSFLLMLQVPDWSTESNFNVRNFHFVLYSLISVENILFAIFAVTIPTSDVKHMSVLKPIILWLVVIGVVLGTIFHIGYNKFLKQTKEPHESNEEENM